VKSKPKKKPKTSTTARAEGLGLLTVDSGHQKKTSMKVIAEKFVTPAELCEGAFAAACKEGGSRAENEPDAPFSSWKGSVSICGPVHALDRVDFAVKRREVVGLVGDNGAGKSTLGQAIAGINSSDSARSCRSQEV